MISLLECIIIQGYFRTVCFTTSYREMLEAHYHAISPKPLSPQPKGPKVPCESRRPVLPPSFLQRQQSCEAAPGRVPCIPALRQHLLHQPGLPCFDAKAPTPAYTEHTGGSARRLNSAKWSGASVLLLLLFACERASLCRSEANDWLSVVLRSAFQLPRGWHTWAEWQVRPLQQLQAAFVPNKRNWAFER